MKITRGNRGAAAVEFAVLFLLLMIILFGIIEFGFIWVQSHYIANAAREGARVASTLLDPKNTPAEKTKVHTAVKKYLKGVYNDARVDKPANCCDTVGDFIYVKIDYKNDDGTDLIDGGAAGVIPAVKVTVAVQTGEVWKPILWDLLKLLTIPPEPGNTNEYEIIEFAVFPFGP